MTSPPAGPAEATATGPASDSPILEIRGAARRYGSIEALRGVDLHARPGEVLALLGPNGAGKTTLLRAVSGRVALDAGDVRLGGRDPRREPEARRALGLVPQAIALYPHLTARENLWVFGRMMGVAGEPLARAVDEALEHIDLVHRADDRAGELSGGMQRRLNIAAGTLHRPAVLLLDEPTVGVDPRARESIHALLRGLRRAGLAIVLTTHDMEEAGSLADRVAFLVEGRITAEGTPRSLVEQTFGTDRELIVTLTEPPRDSERSLLGARGLTATRIEQIWTGRLTGDFDTASGIAAEMRRAGLAISEFRVREPGLQGVFLQLTGREFS